MTKLLHDIDPNTAAPFGEGICATVQIACVHGEPVILRTCPRWINAAAQARVIEKITSAGIKTPKLLDRDGDRFLFEFIDGTSCRDLIKAGDRDCMKAFCETQELLHQIRNDEFGIACSDKTYASFQSFLKDHNKRKRNYLPPEGRGGPAYCHYDFNPHNVIGRNGNSTDLWVLDFDEGIWGPPKFDIAHTRCILAELYPDWVSVAYDDFWSQRGVQYDEDEMQYLHYCRMGKDWETIMNHYQTINGRQMTSSDYRRGLEKTAQ